MKFSTIFLVGEVFGFLPAGLYPDTLPNRIFGDFKTAWTVELHPYTFDCYTHLVETWLTRITLELIS